MTGFGNSYCRSCIRIEVLSAPSRHVLIRRALSKELPIARVPFVSWAAVVKCAHMPYDSLRTIEFAIARLAFIVTVHVEFV
jgi:hypothetical protein